MTVRERRASGLESLALTTELLQRVRLADPTAGVWEAADLQWWWRTPRPSDTVEQSFWADDVGPVAAVVLTDWGMTWGCDPIVVPGVASVTMSSVWQRGRMAVDDLGLDVIEILVRDDDSELRGLVAAAGFVPRIEQSGITWMDLEHRRVPASIPDGFRLVDRAASTVRPHPMRRRNGEAVDDRLRQCSLYDPRLDLAVESADGEVAGYALFWFDPVTKVGLLEPMRVEEAFQRRGLARALIASGLERLIERGATRAKIGYGNDVGHSLYVGAGFVPTITTTAYRWTRATSGLLTR
jgi:predicted N-acetyltransferase YhbS